MEVFNGYEWVPGVVRFVVRLSTFAGVRAYRYKVAYAAVFETGPPILECHLGDFDQVTVRVPGKGKHSTRVQPKPKKLPRPLRAHSVKAAPIAGTGTGGSTIAKSDAAGLHRQKWRAGPHR